MEDSLLKTEVFALAIEAASFFATKGKKDIAESATQFLNLFQDLVTPKYYNFNILIFSCLKDFIPGASASAKSIYFKAAALFFLCE